MQFTILKKQSRPNFSQRINTMCVTLLFLLKTSLDILVKSKVIFQRVIISQNYIQILILHLYRLFGGLIEDIKRKVPFYISDFKDGFHIQCLGAVLFMYLATLTPNITFGALLGQSTQHYMVRDTYEAN